MNIRPQHISNRAATNAVPERGSVTRSASSAKPGGNQASPSLSIHHSSFSSAERGSVTRSASSAEPGPETASRSLYPLSSLLYPSRCAAFTMVEIAICLAIIGLALVSIIGVLPIGMNVQRANREETVINQDATIFLESIRNGVRSGFDLTNYVFAITNYWTEFSSLNNIVKQGANGYTATSTYYYGGASDFRMTNNAQIIGLLSTPEFQMLSQTGTANRITPTNNLMSGGYSNHVYAYVHALSGPANEKPPQDNPILVGDSFAYRILVVNSPVAMDTNLFGFSAAQQVYNSELAANLHELRLTFAWPLRPNGLVSGDGPVPQTQRTLVAGTIVVTADHNQPLYYYQSQSFTNVP